MISSRLSPFGTTIFTEMTLLANRHAAVNLAQGFPDFDGPAFVHEAAIAAVREGKNQYARMFGVASLNAAIASWHARHGGGRVDPETEVTVTSGCTEAIAAAMLGLLEPGDGVVLFEPYYDSYRASVAMAGASPRFVALRPTGAKGGFAFDEAELRAAFEGRGKGGGARAVLLNTPHNPTGKVFTREEMELIARLCVEHDAVALVDEVYERLTYDPAKPHVRMSGLPGMRERTVMLSSLGKTFSLTGWKVGWAIAPPPLTAGIRAAHQFLTFATATPLQFGAAAALDGSGPGEDAIRELHAHLSWARTFLGGALADLGFEVHPCEGTYFLMVGWRGSAVAERAGPLDDDRALCRFLTEEVKVAAIPPSVFYDRPELGRSMVRFAFCKKRETLEEAVRRLRAIAGA